MQLSNKITGAAGQNIQRLEGTNGLQQNEAREQKISQSGAEWSVLSQAIESSRGNVREMMEETKLSTIKTSSDFLQLLSAHHLPRDRNQKDSLV